jgi:hypothetical protein
MGSKGEPSLIKRKRTKRGLIKEVLGRSTNSSEYIVIVEIFDADGKSEGTTKPIPLIEDPSFLAANYGTPEDLVNRYWCEIQYEGPSINRGRATIIGDRIRNKEVVAKNNELQIKGTAFAPPGSGLI